MTDQPTNEERDRCPGCGADAEPYDVTDPHVTTYECGSWRDGAGLTESVVCVAAKLSAAQERIDDVWHALGLHPCDDFDQALDRIAELRHEARCSADVSAANAKLQAEVERLKLKLADADVMANAVDELVRRGAINSRSVVSDKRLGYGEPWQYDFNDDLPFALETKP